MAKPKFSEATFFWILPEQVLPARPRRFPLFIYLRLNRHLILRFQPETEVLEGQVAAYLARGLKKFWIPKEFQTEWLRYLEENPEAARAAGLDDPEPLDPDDPARDKSGEAAASSGANGKPAASDTDSEDGKDAANAKDGGKGRDSSGGEGESGADSEGKKGKDAGADGSPEGGADESASSAQAEAARGKGKGDSSLEGDEDSASAEEDGKEGEAGGGKRRGEPGYDGESAEGRRKGEFTGLDSDDEDADAEEGSTGEEGSDPDESSDDSGGEADKDKRKKDWSLAKRGKGKGEGDEENASDADSKLAASGKKRRKQDDEETRELAELAADAIADPGLGEDEKRELLSELARQALSELARIPSNDRPAIQKALGRLSAFVEDAIAGPLAEHSMGALAKNLARALGSPAAHSEGVQSLAVAFAMLAGIVEEGTLADIAVSAQLHDLGMAALPPGEWPSAGHAGAAPGAGARHVELAFTVLGACGIQLAPRVKTLIRQHHERYAGGGVPAGIRGDAFLDSAQILAMADLFAETLLAPGSSLSPAQAMESVRGDEGRFDTELLGLVAEGFRRAAEGDAKASDAGSEAGDKDVNGKEAA